MKDIEEDEEEEEEEEEPIMDIDGRDKKNPLAVVEYVEDIYAYYRKMEVHTLISAKITKRKKGLPLLLRTNHRTAGLRQHCSCVSEDYMSRQFDINDKMRAILIDWLIEVQDRPNSSKSNVAGAIYALSLSFFFFPRMSL